MNNRNDEDWAEVEEPKWVTKMDECANIIGCVLIGLVAIAIANTVGW